MRSLRRTCVSAVLVVCLLGGASALEGATIVVAAGGDLQAAINAAQPGDTILVQAGALFVGNFVLPKKTGDTYITIRTSTPDGSLPPRGTRIRPSDAPRLAKLQSPNDAPALLTAAGAHHWRIQYLEFGPNHLGLSEIIRLGDGSSAQSSLALVPHHLILEHLYVHGDPQLGQKRGIATNASYVEIRDSHISDIKAVAQDTQALGAWNGPGPFTIENNYLEAAGENVLFGGSDPYIANLVADGITIRRNLFSRPMSWMQPIVPTPESVSASAQTGGTLAAGLYAYRVVARRPAGGSNIARSTASAEAAATVPSSGGAVRITWAAVPDATEYRVYGRTSGTQSRYWTVKGTEFVDTGGAGTSEAVPTTAGTMWTVKNLFELKNARNVLVEANIFQNHWKHAQAGYSIVYTPRNSGGTCNWCVVENVTFQWNLVRNVASGVNILGYDDTDPSGQTNNLIFRQNLFYDVKRSLGGNAWFILIGDEPRDITVEHNTFDSDGSTVVTVYGGTATDPREVYGFRMTDNAARHGSYGMGGSHFTYGNGILTNYYPGYVFLSNYLAGGSTSRYPAGTLVTTPFESQFVNQAARDYNVRADSPLYRAGSDGMDVGVDFPALMAAIAGVEAGVPGSGSVPPTASFTSSCAGLTCSFTDTSSDEDGGIAGWNWSFGDGSLSTLQNPTHTFTAAGSYTVSLTVADDDGNSTTATRTVTVAAPPAPANTSHIGDLDGSRKIGTSSWTARVVIVVHDGDENRLGGAVVSYEWGDGAVGTCTTNTKGRCTASRKVALSTGSTTVTIVSITSPNAYQPSANHDVDGSSSGTSIAISK